MSTQYYSDAHTFSDSAAHNASTPAQHELAARLSKRWLPKRARMGRVVLDANGLTVLSALSMLIGFVCIALGLLAR